MKRSLWIMCCCVALSGCGAETPNDPAPQAKPPAVGAAATGNQSPGAETFFQATIRGAAELDLAGTKPVAGAKFGRYHINMASPPGSGTGPVVIAFARQDESFPASGTYQLGSRDGFTGSVEIYGDPLREFTISSGELVITAAQGDVLIGHFNLTAQESLEEYEPEPVEIQVDGKFKAVSAN